MQLEVWTETLSLTRLVVQVVYQVVFFTKFDI